MRPSVVVWLELDDATMLHRIDAAILGLAVAPHPPGSKTPDRVISSVSAEITESSTRSYYEHLVVLVVNVGHRRDIYRDR